MRNPLAITPLGKLLLENKRLRALVQQYKDEALGWHAAYDREYALLQNVEESMAQLRFESIPNKEEGDD
jgi:hypothetical protein